MAFRRLALMAFWWGAVLSMTAGAQTEPIAWLPNIDAAKAEARATGRLVLVHFWTEDCAPCVALERNVFTQPEVAAALKAQFVPVKLNANANPATASTMGVTRVPTDVVITPDGQVVGRLISPSTPMAYVAELTQVATNFKGRLGQAMDGALAAAPHPSGLNSAAMNGPSSQFVPSVTAQIPQQLHSAAAVPQPHFNSVYAGLQLNTPVAQVAPQAPYGPSAAAIGDTSTAAPSPTGAATIQNRYGEASVSPPSASGAIVNNHYASSATPAIAPATQPAAAGQVATTNNSQLPAAAPPDPRRLPPGVPPLGFDGYCPVSMRSEWRWVPGDPQFGVIHRGRTYWFAGPTQKQQFLANPDLYSPALSGIDPVLAVDHRQQVPGKREHSIDYDNLFYLFASEASLQQFTANPERYAASVRAAMGIQRARSVR